MKNRYIITLMNTEKNLTDRQTMFLENLVSCGGDVKLAAEMSGYAPGTHYAVVKALRSEILDITESILAVNAPQAAHKLVELLTSTEPLPQANIKLAAAQTLLDRVGVAKTERLDVKMETPNGIFILPAKKSVMLEGEYEEEH